MARDLTAAQRRVLALLRGDAWQTASGLNDARLVGYRQLRSLSARGWVERTYSDDGRAVLWRRTPAGTAALEECGCDGA